MNDLPAMMRRSIYSLVRAANAFRRRVRVSEAWFLLLALLVGWIAGLAALALGTMGHAAQSLLFALGSGERLSSLAAIDPLRLLALPAGAACSG